MHLERKRALARPFQPVDLWLVLRRFRTVSLAALKSHLNYPIRLWIDIEDSYASRKRSLPELDHPARQWLSRNGDFMPSPPAASHLAPDMVLKTQKERLMAPFNTKFAQVGAPCRNNREKNHQY